MKQPSLPLLGVAAGMCQCGCGRQTRRASRKRNGYEKGEPVRYAQGHGRFSSSKAARLEQGRCLRGHNLRVVGRTNNGDCRQCARVATSRFNERNPELGQVRRRRRNLKCFGLTVEAYDALAEQQQGRCAICRHFPTINEKALAVDHDHKTGAIRGLLCASCNLAIGKFHDSADLLRAAADYLDRARAAVTLKAV